MSVPATPVQPAGQRSGSARAEHVFADPPLLAQPAAQLAVLAGPSFLTEIGWDAAALVLFLPSGHRLLGRSVCRAPGCAVSAPQRSRLCAGCQRRLSERGLGREQVELLPARERPDHRIGGCVVPGCGRQWASGAAGLCRQHLDQRQGLRLDLAEFLAHPHTVALSACPPCAVASCPRQRRHRDGCYCDSHQLRLRTARRAQSGFDEQAWQRTEPPIGAGGQVSLRGLPALVVVEVLLGLQQRCRVDRVRTKEGDLRSICDDLRRQQVASIADYRLAPTRSLAFAGLVNALSRHARRALSTPALEAAGDQWDLALFGHFGTVSFTGLTQDWLRESAKRWAIDDLPKRRIRPGRGTSAGLSVRHHVGALARLAESLRMRPDRGQVPAALGRADIETFLNRLAYLASSGRSAPTPGSARPARSGTC